MLYSPRLATDGLSSCKQCAEIEEAVTESVEQDSELKEGTPLQHTFLPLLSGLLTLISFFSVFAVNFFFFFFP